MSSRKQNSPPIKVLGKGSYGCVIEPAMPNKNMDGTERQFPGEVTKLFYDSNSYQKALENVGHLPLLGPNAVYPIEKYKRQIHARNLTNHARINCGFQLDNENMLYGVHMPNLGLSVEGLINDIKSVQKLRQLPYKTLFGQILKLMNQVSRLLKSGYVHGDIRESNVLIHPEHGTMSIIDFDWLMPWDDFKETYPGSFYSGPPESVLMRKYAIFENSQNTVGKYYEVMRKSISAWLAPYNILLMKLSPPTANIWGSTRKPGIILDTTYAHVQKYRASVNRRNAQGAQGAYDAYNAYDAYLKRLYNTFDSYGLALSIIILLDILYPGAVSDLNHTNDNIRKVARMYYRPGVATDRERAEFIILLRKVNDILYGMFDIYSDRRLHIDDAIKEMNEAMTTDLSRSRSVSEEAAALAATMPVEPRRRPRSQSNIDISPIPSAHSSRTSVLSNTSISNSGTPTPYQSLGGHRKNRNRYTIKKACLSRRKTHARRNNRV